MDNQQTKKFRLAGILCLACGAGSYGMILKNDIQVDFWSIKASQAEQNGEEIVDTMLDYKRSIVDYNAVNEEGPTNFFGDLTTRTNNMIVERLRLACPEEFQTEYGQIMNDGLTKLQFLIDREGDYVSEDDALRFFEEPMKEFVSYVETSHEIYETKATERQDAMERWENIALLQVGAGIALLGVYWESKQDTNPQPKAQKTDNSM